VIFAAAMYLSPNGWHICDAAACEGKIELKIGFGGTKPRQKVER
jgi:hypothetical protein